MNSFLVGVLIAFVVYYLIIVVEVKNTEKRVKKVITDNQDIIDKYMKNPTGEIITNLARKCYPKIMVMDTRYYLQLLDCFEFHMLQEVEKRSKNVE